jgi:transposase-like protein
MKMREIRAMAIISKGDMPTAISSEDFMMPSQTDKDKKYHVHHKEEWTCDCPDFQHTKSPCKHILATQFWIKMRAKSDADGAFDIEKEILDKDSCAYCGSENVVKNGNRKTQGMVKQRFMCRDCKRTFIENKDFEKFKGEPKLITLVMDLYFKGVSLRKIKDHVNQFYGRKIHHETVRRWIVRFTKKMNDYVRQFKPETGNIWHADEQFVRTRTGSGDARGDWAYCWNVLDSDSRFLIASRLTQYRERNQARAVMRIAKNNTKTEPKTIVTDKLKAYDEAIRLNFKDTEHKRYKGFKDNPQNNRIERFHGTFRERDKVMRGLKSVKTAQAYAESFKTYYNFVRPHSALGGLTPAQALGINLNLCGNRWLSLIKTSSLNKI